MFFEWKVTDMTQESLCPIDTKHHECNLFLKPTTYYLCLNVITYNHCFVTKPNQGKVDPVPNHRKHSAQDFVREDFGDLLSRKETKGCDEMYVSHQLG